MPQLPREMVQRKLQTVSALDKEFSFWEDHFLDMATYLLPRRYDWLKDSTTPGPRTSVTVNKNIYDSTGTKAARKLSAGLMGGMTSPARPWFNLNLVGHDQRSPEPQPVRAYLDSAQKLIFEVLAGSNFYTTLASLYLDLCVFGTSCFLLYEDDVDVVRCYLSPVGEFRLAQDSRRHVDTVCRTLKMTVTQIVARFGVQECSRQVQEAYARGGERLQEVHTVLHLIEPNDQREEFLGPEYAYREFYWEKASADGQVLSLTGFQETPILAPRWDLVGNDVYGNSPGMDALPDVKQLQHETLRKAQALDKLVNPPLQVDAALRQQPALVPGGISYVPSSSTTGIKPLYTVNPPIGEMTRDIQELRISLRETFYNDLFEMISQIPTVRSATEIDARQEEKLVLLGPTLERFENEVLEPVVMRVFMILLRRGMLEPPPDEVVQSGFRPRYTSILSAAQRAANSGALERFMQIVGSLGATFPEVLKVPNVEELLREYADQLNVPAIALRTRREVAEAIAQEQAMVQQQQEALVGQQLAQAAKTMSETGGG